MESRKWQRHTRVVSVNLRESAQSSTMGFAMSSLSRSPGTFRVLCGISVLGQFHLPMKELRNSPVHYHPEIISSGSRYHVVYSNAYYEWHGRSSYPFCTFNPIVLRLRMYRDYLLRQWSFINRRSDLSILCAPSSTTMGASAISHTHPVPF